MLNERKSHPGNSSHASALPGPNDITRVKLPNNIVVLNRENFNSPSVVVRGYLPAGSIFDPGAKLGLADFTVSALMRGTEHRSFGKIYDALETAGASLGFGGATHTIGFNGRALVEDFDLLLRLLTEALRQPLFPEDQIERLRAQLFTSLALRSQSTGEMASLTFDQIIYNGHPYSRPADGYPETIQAIEIADLKEFHQKHYGPNGMVISVVGAVNSFHVVDKITQYLGDWQNFHQPEPPPLPEVKQLRQVHTQQVTIPGKSQADVILGAAGPSRKSSHYLAAALGNNILGQFGMMGRIGEAVREKAGLAYYASSSLSAGVGPGPWYVSAGFSPDDVQEGIDLIISEIERFISDPVRDEELDDSQANFIGRLPLSLESNAGMAAALTNLERYQLGLDYYKRYPDLVRSITALDVLETAQQYLDPTRLGIASAGPA